MTTSAIGSQLDAIRAGLAAVGGLSGVNIFSGVVGVEEAGQECVAFGNGTLEEVELSMGGNRLETWQIGGEVYVVKPWAGTTETTIEAARDRALAIFALVETYINDTYSGTMPDVAVNEGEIENGYGTEGRWCLLSFGFKLRASKNP